MNFPAFLQRLRRPMSRDTRRQFKKHPRPLCVEPLEGRTVPSILFDSFPNARVGDGNGPVINTVHVELIFWGKSWQQDQASKELEGKMETDVKTILGGPYLNGLAQYRNGAIKSGRLAGSVPITATSPGATFIEGQAVQMLTANMKSDQNPKGALPNPKDDPQLLYVVVTQPGSTGMDFTFPQHPITYGGVHRFAQFGTSTFRYAVLSNPAGTSGQSRLDALTYIFSHELVEAASDPELNAIQLVTGQIQPSPANASNELSDNNAQKYAYRLSDVVVQSYWSQKDTAFIVPTEDKQNFLVNGNRTLIVRGDQLASKDDTITLDRSDAGGVIVELNNEKAQFDPCKIGTVDVCSVTGVTIDPGAGKDNVTIVNTAKNTQVLAGTGDDTITLVSTSTRTLTTVYPGKGSNTVNIGDPVNGLLDKIPPGTINIRPPEKGGKLAVNYNDQAYAGKGPYTLTSTNLTRPSQKDPKTLLTRRLPKANSITLNAGGGSNTINVQGTAASVATMVNAGAGGDTINVGNAKNVLDDLHGPLAVNGQGNNTILNINDQGSAKGNKYTRTDTTIQVERLPNTLIRFGMIDRLNLNTGPDSTTKVKGNNAAGAKQTSINGGRGYNTIEVPEGFVSTDQVQFTNEQALVIDGGALDIASALLFRDFALSSGMLTGPGTFTVTGTGTWTGGTMAGTGATEIIAGAVLQVSGPEDKFLLQRALNNAGQDTWAGSGKIAANDGAAFNNLAGGVFDIQAVASFGWSGGSRATFHNESLVLESAGTGATQFSSNVTFDNTGFVRVESGTLDIINTYTQTAGLTDVSAGATLASGGGVNILGGTLQGFGTVKADVRNNGLVSPGEAGVPGVLTIDGNYTQSLAGTLQIDLGGVAANQFDRLAIARDANLDGTLRVGLINRFVPALSDSFQVMSFLGRNPPTSDFAVKDFPNLDPNILRGLYFSTNLTLVVQGSTTTALSSSANPSVFGQNVTFTAKVTPVASAASTPTGTVAFESRSPDGTIVVTLGTAQLDSSGTAKFSMAVLVPAPHTIFAVYLGDNNYAPSTSAEITQIVQRADTMLTVSSSNPVAVAGSPVTFTAHLGAVPPGSFVIAPTGTLTFYDDFEGTTTLLAVITLGGPPGRSPALTAVGSHLISAVYSGDSYYNGSTSPAITQIIVPGASPVPPAGDGGPAQGPGLSNAGAVQAAPTGPSLPWNHRDTGTTSPEALAMAHPNGRRRAQAAEAEFASLFRLPRRVSTDLVFADLQTSLEPRSVEPPK